MINDEISNKTFPASEKLASVRIIYKRDDRNEIKSYRPVGILNSFSKIYEQFLNEQLLPFINFSLSEFISAYRNGYSTNHILIQLNENWRYALENDFFTGAFLVDLLKAFDCISQDFLIARLHAYGIDFDTVMFLYNYS